MLYFRSCILSTLNDKAGKAASTCFVCCSKDLWSNKCDVIKQNESELTNSDFKVQQSKADNNLLSVLLTTL